MSTDTPAPALVAVVEATAAFDDSLAEISNAREELHLSKPALTRTTGGVAAHDQDIATHLETQPATFAQSPRSCGVTGKLTPPRP